MIFVAVVFIGFWDLLTRSGMVSPIILPTPVETLKDMVFVGKNILYRRLHARWRSGPR